MAKPKSEGTDALSDEIDALVAKDQEQDARLNDIDTMMAEMNERLSALEKDNPDPPDPNPEPPMSDYPDENNTGAQGELEDYRGPMRISTNGAVIENQRINGDFAVGAKDVVIRNCEINPTGPWGLDASGADNCLLEAVTVTGKDRNDSAVYMGTNSVARRLKLSGYVNGLIFGGGTQLLEDSLIYKLGGAPDEHFDGCVPRGGGFSVQENGKQVDGIPQVGVTIRHNTIYGRDTSCIFCKPDFGPVTDLLIEDNQLLGDPEAGPSGYPIYAVTNPSMPPIKGVVVKNNKIQKGRYGYASLEDNDPEWSGNVDYDTGEEIEKPEIQWNTK